MIFSIAELVTLTGEAVKLRRLTPRQATASPSLGPRPGVRMGPVGCPARSPMEVPVREAGCLSHTH